MATTETHRKIDNLSAALLVALSAFFVFVWYEILFSGPRGEPRLFFLDVGQGDATLAELPGGIQILTDAGPSRKILDSLGAALKNEDRYVDLAIISHPQLDHYNGFNYLLDHYRFGAFLFNGNSSDAGEWKILTNKIEELDIPFVVLGAGDKIRYGANTLDVLSPNRALLQSAEPNDTGIVALLKTPPFSTLFTADIGTSIEKYLAENFRLRADVLKVPHHGSKYSSSDILLGAVKPKLAVIGVGSENRYGHPTEEALSRIWTYTKNIFRTDKNGTVEVSVDGRELSVFSEK